MADASLDCPIIKGFAWNIRRTNMHEDRKLSLRGYNGLGSGSHSRSLPEHGKGIFIMRGAVDVVKAEMIRTLDNQSV